MAGRKLASRTGRQTRMSVGTSHGSISTLSLQARELNRRRGRGQLTATLQPRSILHDSLALLAATAAAANSKTKNTAGQLAMSTLLTLPGPFNPAAALSAKVVKKIMDLDFIEMSEVTIDDAPPQVLGRPPPPTRLPITDISQWLERYSLMVAVLCTKFPDKAGELFAYQASIV